MEVTQQYFSIMNNIDSEKDKGRFDVVIKDANDYFDQLIEQDDMCGRVSAIIVDSVDFDPALPSSPYTTSFYEKIYKLLEEDGSFSQ